MPQARTGARTRARRGDGAKLRAQVLDVAESLLLETGSSRAVSVRAIADRCGVTPPAIYLHFADKAALFREVCDRRFQGLTDRIESAVAAATDPLDGLRLMGLAFVRFGLEHPETYRAVVESRLMDGDSAGRAGFDQVAKIVDRATQAGAFGDTDPRTAALVVWSGLHGITSLMISFPDLEWGDRDEIVEHNLDVLIEGLLST